MKKALNVKAYTSLSRWIGATLSIATMVALATRSEGAIDFYRLGKRISYVQTSASQPTTEIGMDGGVDISTNNPLDMASVRVFSTNPTLLSPASPFVLTQFAPTYWGSSRGYSSVAEMDTDLPPGDIFGYLIEGGELGARLALLSIPETNLFPSDVPYFTGSTFDDLNGLDTSSPYTVNWNGYAPADGVSEAPIFLGISRVTDGQFITGTVVANTVTSFVIPANTFAPGTQYRADLSYSSRVNTFDAGFVVGDASVTFDLSTNLIFTTAVGADASLSIVPEPASIVLSLGGLLAMVVVQRIRPVRRRAGRLCVVVVLVVTCSSVAEANIDFYRLGKRIGYLQTDDNQPTTPIGMDAGVDLVATDPGDLTSARVFSTIPTAPGPVFEFNLTEDAPGYWRSSRFYASLEEIDTELPPGDTFGYLIEGGSLGSQLALLPTPVTNLFSPEVPYFTNNAFSELNDFDTTAPFTISWNGYTPLDGINDAPIFFTIFRVSDGQSITGTVVANTVTSFLIPANTLAPDTQYRAILDYSSRVNTFDAGFVDGNAGITFDLVTDLYFTTNPILPGDYNRDGVVGAADYTVWRNSLGQMGVSPLSGADGDGDGDILAADYDVWKTNFGATAGSGASVIASTVPEPAGIALVVCGLLVMISAGHATSPVRRI